MSADHISLTVPARAEYAKTVRMAASALAARLNLTYDEVDDVRIAAEEAFVYAVDHAPESSEVRLDFTIGPDAFEIRVGLAPGSRIADEEGERRAAYATFILQAVCDHFELSSDETGSYLKVVKSIPAEQPDAEK